MRTGSRRWVAVVAVLVAVGIGFLVYAAPQLGAPFGESHDGINGAVWGNGSRYLREVGPVDSALGGRRADGTSYANHPPAIYLTTAAAELIAGEGPWSTRASAWLATLASIPLLWFILRRLRLATVPALVGVVVAATTPMVFVYGGMLDTPIIAFPIGLGVFLVWLRAWDGDGTDHRLDPRLVGLLALVAALTAWEATFAVGLAALSLGWKAWRRRDSLAVPVALAAGGATGVVLTVAWSIWATGSTTTLVDQFLGRSGSEGGATWLGAVSNQQGWLRDLLGVALIGVLVCAAAAIWDHGLRRVAAAGSLAVVFGYAVLLHSGAYHHQYWNYWVTLPVAIGFGYGAEAVMRALRTQGGSRASATAIVLLLALIVVMSSRLAPSADRTMMDDGDVPARLLQSQPLPAAQDSIRYVGAIYDAQPWLTYLTRRPAAPLTDRGELDALAEQQPDALLLTSNSCVSDDQLCFEAARLPAGAAIARAGHPEATEYRIYSAGGLATALDSRG
jgi:hypothetical protein